MYWIIELAVRNIRRNPRRTALALASIALSVALTSFLNGFTGGVMRNMVKNITKNETGHVRITTTGFEERERFMPLDELIYRGDEIRRAVAEIPELREKLVLSTERILFGTLLSRGSAGVSALGIAADARNEKELLNLDRSVVEGRYIEDRGEAILGIGAARDLGVAVGDSLPVLTQGADYSLRLKRFRVVGLFSSGLSQLDGSVFQVPLEDAEEFLRTDGGVQQILVTLKDYRDAEAAAALIEDALNRSGLGEGLAVRPWTAIGEYPRLIGTMETMYGWISVVVTFLGAFIISNIMMMVILERRKEIGILKAMGLKRRDILLLFVSEGTAMGLAGSALGALLGLGLCGIFSVYGIDFSAAMASMTFPLDPVYYAVVDPASILAMFGLGAAVSLAVSLLPSRRAAAMDPVEAIKSVA